MIIDQIRNDFLEARKTKNTIKSKLISVILGEIEKLEKSKNRNSTKVSDDEVIKLLKPIKSKLIETMDMLSDQSPYLLTELAIINEYLPVELTKKEIESWLNSNYDLDNRNKPVIMKAAKQQFGQLIDMKYLSSLIDI